MGTCETVRVNRDSSDGHGDYTIVNKSDFDSKTMKLWKPPKPAKKKAAKKK